LADNHNHDDDILEALLAQGESGNVVAVPESRTSSMTSHGVSTRRS
jgi:hypothetical protein